MAASTISPVGQAQAATTTVTLPSNLQQGDIIIIFAYRTAITAPTLPAGWTTVTTVSGNSNSLRVGWKAANGTSDTSGTWTNASILQCSVYRGTGGIGVVASNTKAAATTANIGALTLGVTDGSSWVVAGAGSVQTVAQGVPLAGATTQRGTSQASASGNAGIFDTNGGVSSFSATTSSNNSSVVSAGFSFELLSANQPPYTLKDNFDDNSVNAVSWFTEFDTSVTVLEQNGQIEITIPAVTGYGRLMSRTNFNIYGAYVTGRIVDAGNQASGVVDAHLAFITDLAELNHLFWQIENNVLFAIYGLNGSDTTLLGTLAYNAALHKYFRIRESSGTIYWDWSTDGIGWVFYASIPTATFTYGLLAMRIGFQAGVFTTPTTTTIKMDDFNTLPMPPPVFNRFPNPNVGPMASRVNARWPQKPYVNTSAPIGTLYFYSDTGTLSFTGNMAKRTNKPLTGVLSFTGAIVRTVSYVMTATLSFTGVFTKRTSRALAGVLSFTGTFAASHRFFQALTGSLSFTGTFTKRTNKSLAGVLSFTGALTKRLSRALSGVLSFTGAMTKRTLRALTGVLSFTGVFVGAQHTPTNSIAFTAALSFNGNLTKRINKSFTASLSFVGTFLSYIPSIFINIAKVINTLVTNQTVNGPADVANVDTADTIKPVDSVNQSGNVNGEDDTQTINTTDTNKTV